MYEVDALSALPYLRLLFATRPESPNLPRAFNQYCRDDLKPFVRQLLRLFLRRLITATSSVADVSNDSLRNPMMKEGKFKLAQITKVSHTVTTPWGFLCAVSAGAPVVD